MPKKNEKSASRLTYDVSRVSPTNLKPIILTLSERNEVIKSFQPTIPSEKFLSDYERAVRFFVWDAEEIQKVTPSKVRARIKGGIHKNAQQLLNNLLSLELTDHSLLDRHFTSQFLQNRQCVSVNKFISYLTLFMENTEEAVSALEDVQKSGRMPAFAEQCLASSIGYAIQEETGSPPTLTRNGIFSRVLKCALSVGDKEMSRRIGKERRDVMELMRHARVTMTQA